ncbi:MAG: hypothetical protein WBG30_11550 [Psychrilyobacter sp.]|uniref:lysine 5,6-aminomutase reactivase ATPase KamC n=1 Tax=Psychrilyobacter sp. TaxID=2586924 RepID=UPI003C714309
MRYLDLKNREKIGLEYLINNLTTISPYGNQKKRDIAPIKDSKTLKETFDHLEFFIKKCQKNKKEIQKIELLLMKLKNISNIVLNLQNGKTLDEVELFELKINTMIFMEIKSITNNIFLKDFHLVDLSSVIDILDPGSKKISTFYIYNEYSKKLKEIRNKKSKIEKLIFLAKDNELQIKLKEERREIVVLENCEESKVKIDISKKLISYTSNILININKVKNIDFTLAKAKLALKYGANRPIIGEHIEFIGMFNPEILETLKVKNQEFQKLDILLKNGNTILTGANMGGKSVILKTLTLNLILAQMGFYVFSDHATIPLLNFIQFLSDDIQDVSKGLSSFGAEIIKLREITGCLTTYDKGFIALDEFARGTNPSEGKKFVKGLSNYMKNFDSFSIMATHYDGVVDDLTPHYQVVGLKNINFDSLKRKIDLNNQNSISLIQKHMDYSIEKIHSNFEVPKDALNVATLIGIDENLKNIIKKLY